MIKIVACEIGILPLECFLSSLFDQLGQFFCEAEYKQLSKLFDDAMKQYRPDTVTDVILVNFQQEGIQVRGIRV